MEVRVRTSLYCASLLDSGPEYLSRSCQFKHHPDNSIRPVTTALFLYPPLKQKPLVKDPFYIDYTVNNCDDNNCDGNDDRDNNGDVNDNIEISLQKI